MRRGKFTQRKHKSTAKVQIGKKHKKSQPFRATIFNGMSWADDDMCFQLLNFT